MAAIEPTVNFFLVETDLDVASSEYNVYVDGDTGTVVTTDPPLSLGGNLPSTFDNTVKQTGWSLDGGESLGYMAQAGADVTDLDITSTAVRYLSFYVGIVSSQSVTLTNINFDFSNVGQTLDFGNAEPVGSPYTFSPGQGGDTFDLGTTPDLSTSSPIMIVEIDLGASYVLNGNIKISSGGDEGTARLQLIQMSNTSQPANCLVGSTLVRVGIEGPLRPLKDLTTFKAVTRGPEGEPKEVDARVIRSKREGIMETVSYEGLEMSKAHLLMVDESKEMGRSSLTCRKCKSSELYGQKRCSRCGGLGFVKGHKALVAGDALESGSAAPSKSYGRWYHVLLEDGEVHEPFELGVEGVLSEPLRHVLGTAKGDKLWEENL